MQPLQTALQPAEAMSRTTMTDIQYTHTWQRPRFHNMAPSYLLRPDPGEMVLPICNSPTAHRYNVAVQSPTRLTNQFQVASNADTAVSTESAQDRSV